MIVQKYGGSSVASPDKMKQIAKQVKQLKNSGEDVLLVVSAMGTTTNDLLLLSEQITLRPDSRELDMLLSAGERISMSLMCMALHEQGCPAISFTGSQAGILTSDKHSNASIVDVKPTRLPKELDAGKVVVLAGFQGVCPETKEITTLGRGGSDTTAVAMASAFQAKRCEFRKDVAGVFTADPKKNSNAELIKHLSHQELYEMSLWGAKVLHAKAAMMAKEKNVPLYICEMISDPYSGTCITNKTGETIYTAQNIRDHIIVIKGADTVQRLALALLQPFAPQPDVLFESKEKVVLAPTDASRETFKALLNKESIGFIEASAIATTSNSVDFSSSVDLNMEFTKVDIQPRSL